MIVKETLPNGLTLVTEAMPQVRSAAIGVWLKRGSRHEALRDLGISHFIEHMVFKGTTSRSAERIAAEVDSMGGHMDAFTSKEYAAFHVKALDEHLPQAVEILADIVMNPLFDAHEMTKEKKVVCEEISLVEDTPDDLVVELWSAAFWPDHPLGWPILGTKKSVNALTRDRVLAHFRAAHRGGNLLVAAAGNLDHEAVARCVRERFGALPDGGAAPASSPPRARSTVVSRAKKELEQVHLCLGTASYSQTHDGRFAAYVLNTVLGGGLSSRLFQNIREQRGLVYSIASGISAYSDAGALTIYAGTGMETVDEVLRLTMDELRRLRDEPLPPDELRRAKDHLKGGLVLSLESTSSRMSHLARQEIYFERQLSLDDVLASIEAVDVEAVSLAARELLGGELTLSLVGNMGRYRPKAEAIRL